MPSPVPSRAPCLRHRRVRFRAAVSQVVPVGFRRPGHAGRVQSNGPCAFCPVERGAAAAKSCPSVAHSSSGSARRFADPSCTCHVAGPKQRVRRGGRPPKGCVPGIEGEARVAHFLLGLFGRNGGLHALSRARYCRMYFMYFPDANILPTPLESPFAPRLLTSYVLAHGGVGDRRTCWCAGTLPVV